MKYVLLAVACLSIGFFSGLQYAYYKARQIKEEFIQNTEQKYEDVKQKIFNKFKRE